MAYDAGHAELMKDASGMVVATTFASNIARLKTLADAAVVAGRSVCLLGRAMRRMVEAAVETGLLTDFPSTIAPEDALQMPRELPATYCALSGCQRQRNCWYHSSDAHPAKFR